MTTIPRATIVIPAHNEGERLKTGFARLLAAAQEGRIDLETTALLYVDDGSKDDTAEVAQGLIGQLPHGKLLSLERNQGKGAAVRRGIFAVETPLVIFTDADFAIDPRQFPEMLDALAKHRLCVGSRALKGYVDYETALRTRASRTFNALVRSISSVSLRDTQCGWKGMQSSWAKVLFHLVSTQRFAFDVELLVRASSLGVNPFEVSVDWRDVSGSHVRLAKDSLQMLGDLARVRSSRTLPRLLGLETPEILTLQEISEACYRAGLIATPLVTGRSGERTLLAVGLSESKATKTLARIRREFKTGTVRVVTPPEIRYARSIELVGSEY